MAIVNFFAHEGESWSRWGLGGGVGWVTDRVRDDSNWLLGVAKSWQPGSIAAGVCRPR
jgi:hypothetical protein